MFAAMAALGGRRSRGRLGQRLLAAALLAVVAGVPVLDVALCACFTGSWSRALLRVAPHRGGAVLPLSQQRAEGRWKEWDERVRGVDDREVAGPDREAIVREVEVTDQRDVNELLRLKNPLRPAPTIRLEAVKLDDGTVISKPNVMHLRKLQPSTLRPVTFVWKDNSDVQTQAPKQYDEIIQRLLNAGAADMEEMVRANWKKFDKAFFFRIYELKQDTKDPRLREKIANLEDYCFEVVGKAREQMQKQLPDQAQDAQAILKSMLEPDGKTLLWPAPPEAYKRLSEEITLRATRNSYANAWFENILEVCERLGQQMQKKGDQQMLSMTQVVMQRVITEWLREDSLWEETAEGKFLYRLMCLSHEQWADQLLLEKEFLDTEKLRDELKIISETKVMALPMASKLQLYGAKYVKELAAFVAEKDNLLREVEKQQATR